MGYTKQSLSNNEVEAVTIDREIYTEEEICKEIPALLNWPSVNTECLISLTGGITNKVYKLNHPTDQFQAVIVRIYGGEDIFSREERAFQTKLYKQLSDANISPRLLGIFSNGRVEQYLNARPVELFEMTTSFVCDKVAIALARLHSFKTTISSKVQLKKPTVWENINKWTKEIKSVIRNEMSAGFQINIDLERYIDEAERIQQDSQYDDKVVFSHNDLSAGNLLVKKDVNDESNHITLIDYEYSDYNYRAYDIANFFCEAMGGADDGVVRPHLYPNLQFRQLFCTSYLKEVMGYDPEKKDVDELIEKVERFSKLSHLYWGLWALLQSRQSLVDFPYIKYAVQRLQQFLI